MTDFATFAEKIIEELVKEGKKQIAETRKRSANHLLTFMGDKPIPMDKWDDLFVQDYEAWLKSQGQSSSTAAYYLSQLCTFYKQAAKSGIVQERDIFRLVNKAPTPKSSAQQFPSIAELHYLRTLDLRKSQDFARDMFLFSPIYKRYELCGYGISEEVQRQRWNAHLHIPYVRQQSCYHPKVGQSHAANSRKVFL